MNANVDLMIITPTSDNSLLVSIDRHSRIQCHRMMPRRLLAAILIILLLGLRCSSAMGDETSQAQAERERAQFFAANPDLKEEETVVEATFHTMMAEGARFPNTVEAYKALADRTRAVLQQRSPEEWKQQALRVYPALNIGRSELTSLFLSKYNQLRSTYPAYFNDPSWYMRLARECDQELKAKTVVASTSIPNSSPDVYANQSVVNPTPMANANTNQSNVNESFNVHLFGQALYVIGFILIVLMTFFVEATFIRIATRLVIGVAPTYKVAYLASLLITVVGIAIGFTVGFLFAISGQRLDANTYLILFVIGFCVHSWIYSLLIKHPVTGAIGFGKGCLINITVILICALLVGIVFGIIYAVSLLKFIN